MFQTDMSACRVLLIACCVVFGATVAHAGQPRVVHETTSAYHHIRVVDQDGIRTLSFDGSMETRMSLRNPLVGHFDYTEFFHMPFLWNTNITNVLMIGLGGGSTQRSFQHYYPTVNVETVELDPVVREIAQEYFGLKETEKLRVHINDGRVFLRRTRTKYDLIIVDAYVRHRYGSAVPHHLATKEFFEIARDRVTTNGVIAYNVIGFLNNAQPDLLGSLYKTMNAAFTNVYLFPSGQSQNVVLIGSRSKERLTINELTRRARELIGAKRITVPTLWGHLSSFRASPPGNAPYCKVLTDDFAPVDGLIKVGN